MFIRTVRCSYQTRLQPNLIKKGWDIVLREGAKKKCEKRSG